MEAIATDFFLWRIDQKKLQAFIEHNNSLADQVDVINRTVCSKVNKENPVDPDFCLKFVKAYLRILNSNGHEVDESLYNHIHDLQLKAADLTATTAVAAATNSTKYFKSYFIEDQVVSLAETKEIISNGTTGLTSWPAGIHLCQYVSQNSQLIKGKRVIELGAGTGITGIFCLKSNLPEEYTLTDCHPKVLQNLEVNLQHNLERNLADASSKYKLVNLDWEDPDLSAAAFNQPDVVLGADIVFDSRIIPDLVRTIKILLSNTNSDKECVAVIASTIRNEATYAHFLQELEDQDLDWQDCKYKTDDPVKVIQIKK